MDNRQDTATDKVKKADTTGLQLYQQHCADCHGKDRLGSIGPALLPENLKRLRKTKAVDVISNGRIATQMPAFSDKLSKQQIESLVELVYTPLKTLPVWGESQIIASHIIHRSDTDNESPQKRNRFMMLTR